MREYLTKRLDAWALQFEHAVLAGDFEQAHEHKIRIEELQTILDDTKGNA